MFLGLIISVMVCNVGRSDALMTSAHTLDLAFLTHHKTGSALAYALGHDMASVLHMTFLGWPDPQTPIDQCFSNAIAMYPAGGTLTTIKACPHMRAVHFVRRPTSAFVSD